METPIKFSTLKARIRLMIVFIISIPALIFGAYFCFMMDFWEDLVGLLFFAGNIFTLGLCVYRIIIDNLQLNCNMKELRETYHALEQDWYDLNYADYLDEDLQLLIYGDHLICYRTFDIAYLPECSKIIAFRRTIGGTRSREAVHFQVLYSDGRQSQLRTNMLRGFLGVDQRACIEEVFQYIEENYEYIEIKMI